MLNPLLKIEFLREGRGARLSLMVIFYNAILALITIMIMLVNSQSYLEGYYYDPSTSRFQFIIISTIQIGCSLLLGTIMTWSLYARDQEGIYRESFPLVPGYCNHIINSRMALVVMVNLLLFLSSLPILLISVIYSGVTVFQVVRLGIEILMCALWSTSLTACCCVFGRNGFFSAFLTLLMEVFFFIGTYLLVAVVNGRFNIMGAENVLAGSGHMVYNAGTVMTMLVMSLNPISSYVGYRINIIGDSGMFQSFCAGIGVDVNSRLFSYVFYKMSAVMMVIFSLLMIWLSIRHLRRRRPGK